MRLAALLVVAACGSKGDEPPPGSSGARAGSGTDKVTGSLVVEGKPAELRGCRVGHTVHTFVDIVTSRGILRFDDGDLYWTWDIYETNRGTRLDCQRLDRSWGGGTRTDGTSYWRGKLTVACGPPAIGGSLDVECGNLTTAERLQLESNRQDLLAQQRSNRTIVFGPFTTPIPDGWIDVATSGDPDLGGLAKPGTRVLIAEHPPTARTRSLITIEPIAVKTPWKTCNDLHEQLPPTLDGFQPRLTTPDGDRACTWLRPEQRGQFTVRVRGNEGLLIQLLRGSDPDADADRAFDAIVAELKTR